MIVSSATSRSACLVNIYLHVARAVDDFILVNTMDGADDYGEVAQANPAQFIGPADEQGIPVAERRERANKMADHKKWNTMLFSFLVLLVLDDNLRAMLQKAKRDGYAALKILRAQCYREPNNLTLAELDRVWLAFTFKDVGMNADTFANALRFLAALNEKRPVGRKKTSSDIVIKMRSPASRPTSVHRCAVYASDVELSAPKEERRYWVPAANGIPGYRYWQMMQRHLEPIYRASFRVGGITSPGAHADSALLTTNRIHQAEAFAVDSAPLLSVADIEQNGLRICYRCSGIGHPFSSCGNTANIVVGIDAAIVFLQQHQQGRSRDTKRARQGRGAGHGAGRGAGHRAPTLAWALLTADDEVDNTALAIGGLLLGSDDVAFHGSGYTHGSGLGDNDYSGFDHGSGIADYGDHD